MTKRSILVIGLGRFGVSTATTLANLGHEVVVVDQREEYINAVKDTVLHAMQADTTDERVLERLGVRNFDVVVICIGDDLRASILTTVLCRELGARTIIAKASDACTQSSWKRPARTAWCSRSLTAECAWARIHQLQGHYRHAGFERRP